MPPTRIVIDGLWRVLCPSWNTLPHGTRSSNSIQSYRLLRQSATTPRRNTVQAYSQRSSAASTAQSSNIRAGSRQQKTRARGVAFTFSSIQRRGQERIRKVDLGIAFQTLRRTALEGDYAQTEAYVRILLKERGERPNLRLYDALLLAQADHEKGSAQETARLLDELASEGLTPDSGTYHAALRVKNLSLATFLMSLPYEGTCYSPGLSPQAPNC